MIGESEHFSFDGIKSTDFGIRNVKYQDGLYEEDVVASKEINEVYIRGRKKPYYIDTSEEPKTLQLKFFFDDGWDIELMDKVLMWLNVDYYKPLFFSENIDRVYYVKPINSIKSIHNGLKQGYLTLDMRCDSSMSYSHEIITPEYKLSENKGETSDLTLNNLGHFSTYPEIWIEKTGEGNLSIWNTSCNNVLFEFKDIEIGEKLFVDCENEFIETNKERTYRYDNFNDSYLRLIYGKNRLRISNNMKIKFRYRYNFS